MQSHRRVTATPNIQADRAVNATALGEILWLFSQSSIHRRWFVHDFDTLVYPPLLLGQCRIFRENGRPVAFASWAFMNQDSETAFASRSRSMELGDWTSGSSMWWVDFVAPFGHFRSVGRKLRDMFPEARARFTKFNPEDGSWRIIEWTGLDGRFRYVDNLHSE